MLDRRLNPLSSPPEASGLGREQHRCALALAEALLPTAHGIPGADENTIVATEHFVKAMLQGSAWAPKLWGGALQALDAAAIAYTGRRFSRLKHEQQQALIRRWEDHPVLRTPLYMAGFFFKLAHFDQPAISSRLGHRTTFAQVDTPRWMREQVHDAASWDGDDEIECDVVVIGTGAGGAVVGQILAERGHAVLFVEEGKYHQRDAFNGSSTDALTKLYRNQVFTLGNNVIPIFQGRGVGGSTMVNTGSSIRTPSWILDHWSELLGVDDFSPASMQPYFDRVEAELHVEVPPKEALGPFAEVVARGCDALGWSHFAVPRNAPGCEGKGFCQFGCATDARRSTNLSYIPKALQQGAMLFTGLRADSIRVENGRAVGIEATALGSGKGTGKRLRVRAKSVVLAGGAIPSPLFLLRQGICNSSGQVGRNLSVHPSGGMTGQFEDRINAEDSIPQGYNCDQFLREGILLSGALAPKNFMPMVFALSGERLMEALSHMDHMGSFGILCEDEEANGRVWRDVNDQSIVTYNMTPRDVRRQHKGLVHAAELFFAAGARRVFPAVHGWGIIEDEMQLDAFRRAELSAADILLTAYHPLCTNRMGRDPSTSVVDIHHETHDVPGLFIVDGSTVPTPPSVNPQITIMAMATRAAEHLADRL